MNTKHTQGSWLHNFAAGNHQQIVYSEETGDTIAVVYNDNENDAAIIAAAPTLLSLLIQAKEYLEMREDFLIEDAEEGEENLYTQMKTAIQKATQP